MIVKSKRVLSIVILLFFLAACVPSGGLWGVSEGVGTATFTPPPPIVSTETPAPTAVPLTETVTATPVPRAARVLIVSFDGLRPDAIAMAPMNNLLILMHASQSAYSLSAQTILPSSTLPAHTSMLTGLCPSSHGVDWNEYLPENGYAKGTDLFDLAHAAGLRTVMVVGKEKLRQITEPASTDVFAFVEGSEDDVAQRAIQEMTPGFGVMFVHFPQGDLNGHAYGWLSQMQLWAYRQGDDAFGKLLAGLDFAGLRASTLIIVTADHGGHKTTHGSDAPEDVTIPWIVNGPFVHAGQLGGYIHTTDTAATAAFMLGLPRPADWDGRPVFEAFGLPPEPRAMPVCVYDK
jgi:hypothetical protein